MSAIFPREGRKYTLDIITVTLGGLIKIGLFKNNITIDVTKVLGDLTPADFSGYASQTMVFGASAIDGNGNALSAGDTHTFTHNGGATANTVYGYYLWDNTANKLLFAENFGAPIVLSTNGQFITLTPNMYDGLLPAPL